MKAKLAVAFFACTGGAVLKPASPASAAEAAQTVTIDHFIRAESDRYLGNSA